MKKIVSLILSLCFVWAGSRTLQMNSAAAQQVVGFSGMPSLADQIGFTNTVVPATNISGLQMDELVALLMNLQTNVEQTLPALSIVLSNAANVNASPTPSPSPQFQGAFAPIISNPPSLVSPPTIGATTQSQQQQTFSLMVGTNIFVIDPPTLQALVVLRDNLERTLPVLQALNGTTTQAVTSATNAFPFFPNPTVTSFTPGSLTNTATQPLTNQSPFVGSAF